MTLIMRSKEAKRNSCRGRHAKVINKAKRISGMLRQKLDWRWPPARPVLGLLRSWLPEFIRSNSSTCSFVIYVVFSVFMEFPNRKKEKKKKKKSRWGDPSVLKSRGQADLGQRPPSRPSILGVSGLLLVAHRGCHQDLLNISLDWPPGTHSLPRSAPNRPSSS